MYKEQKKKFEIKKKELLLEFKNVLHSNSIISF